MKHLNEGGKKLLARGAFETSQGNTAGGIVQICPPANGAFFRDKDNPPNLYNANGEPLKDEEPESSGPTADELKAAQDRADAAAAKKAKAAQDRADAAAAKKAKAAQDRADAAAAKKAEADKQPPSTRRTD